MIDFDKFIRVILYFIGMSLVFIPLERSFLSKPYRILRKEYRTDLFFYLGQNLFWNSLTLITLNLLFSGLESSLLSDLRGKFQLFPFLLQALSVILMGDFLIYWGHRWQHKYDWLWRFHRIHHTAERVDYLAAFREHPLDNIYTRGLESLPAFLLGFGLEEVSMFIAFRGIYALFIHSNVSLRLGVLEIIFGSPHLHHWHHEVDRGGKCNFANLNPMMDIIFGTFYNPHTPPKRYGVNEDHAGNYPSLLLEPFLPNDLPKKFRDFMDKFPG